MISKDKNFIWNVGEDYYSWDGTYNKQFVAIELSTNSRESMCNSDMFNPEYWRLFEDYILDRKLREL